MERVDACLLAACPTLPTTTDGSGRLAALRVLVLFPALQPAPPFSSMFARQTFARSALSHPPFGTSHRERLYHRFVPSGAQLALASALPALPSVLDTHDVLLQLHVAGPLASLHISHPHVLL